MSFGEVFKKLADHSAGKCQNLGADPDLATSGPQIFFFF